MQTSAEIFYSFPRVIDLSLDRMKAALSSPLINIDNLPPIIHIAGTNGKGSTLAFLRAMLEAEGKICHVYTSPHLVHIHERYVVSGNEISEEELLKYANITKEIAKNIPLTIFEAETLAGFLAFSENKADYLLLETGLGGRLDATNAIDKKRLCLISPIDYDHKEFLGDDIIKIAREKSGIMRENTPVIIGRQTDEACDAIISHAEKLNAPIKVFGQDFDAYPSYGNLNLQTEDRLYDLPPPSLIGSHQFENAGLAAMAALELGINEDSIAKGLRNAKWPARMQPIISGKAKTIIGDKAEIFLDGGHNPHGAISAANAISKMLNNRPFILIAGLLNNKDASGFFDAFKGLKPICYTVPINSSLNSYDPLELSELANYKGIDANPMDNIFEAIEAAIAKYNNPLILICGSLYMAGDFLAENNK